MDLVENKMQRRYNDIINDRTYIYLNSKCTNDLKFTDSMGLDRQKKNHFESKWTIYDIKYEIKLTQLNMNGKYIV